MNYSYLKILSATILSTSSLIFLHSEPAHGGWLERATGIRTPRVIRNMDPSRLRFRSGTTNPSCFAGVTDERYNFTIENTSSYTVAFYINDSNYRLKPGQYERFSYYKRYGSNSCKVRSYPLPTIGFDYDSSKDGWQTQTYNIGSYNFYKFVNSGEKIELRSN